MTRSLTIQSPLLLIFVMIFTDPGISAQQWSPPGAHWQYTYDSGTGIQGYVELFYTDDTLINNEPAKKLSAWI
jgi:hypothetical protein